MTRTPDIVKVEIDCRGQQCPEPVLHVARAAAELKAQGGFILVRADDPAFPQDIEAWTRSAKVKLVRFDEREQSFEAVLQVGEIGEPGEGAAPRAPARQPAHVDPSARQTMSYGSREEAAAELGLDQIEPHQTFDVRGEQCPQPIVTLAKACSRAAPGAVLRMYADDPAFPYDLRSWASSAAATLLSLTQHGQAYVALVRVEARAGQTGQARSSEPQRLAARPAPVVRDEVSASPDESPRGQALATSRRAGVQRGGCTLLVLHNDHEALLAALLVANGAAAQGMETNVFFTFWGLNLLRADEPDLTQPEEPVGFLQRMMKWMMPSGPTRQPLGQMHFGGLGKGMLGWIMRRKKIMALSDLMRSAQELGVRFTACTMSMSVMGITRRDLYPWPNLEYGGVASFIADARDSDMSLVF